MRLAAFVLVASTLTLGACSRTSDFTPKPGTDAKTMFGAACLECHLPTPSGNAIDYSAKITGPEAVAAKIGSGSMAMPKFPNIQGEELKALSEWVFANSGPKP